MTYDLADHLTATTTDSIVTPAGDRLGVRVGATLNWFVPDPHGNVAGSLDASEATITNAIRYDAYGQTIATGSAGGSPVGEDTWKYQGRLDVSPAGLSTPLYDLSARFYNPGIGAFTQLDSVMGGAQNPLSMNRFLYAHGNPATLIDPTGHCPFCLLLIPVAIGFFAGAGVDAAVQQVTTGEVDWGQAGVSGAIGSVTGGIGGLAAAGTKAVVTAAAKPIIRKAVTYAAGITAQTVAEQTIRRGVYGRVERGLAENLATSTVTQIGADAVAAGLRRAPGKLGAVGRLIDGLFGGRRMDDDLRIGGSSAPDARGIDPTLFRPGGGRPRDALGRFVADPARPAGPRSAGRAGAQTRLREIGADPATSSNIRGWISNEMRQIEVGNRTTIRRPPGYDLAHRRGFPARLGYDYRYSDLQLRDTHRIQTSIEMRAQYRLGGY